MKQGLFPVMLALLVLLVGATATWAAVDSFVLSPARSLEARILEAEAQAAALRSRSARLRAELAELPTVSSEIDRAPAANAPLSEMIVPLLENNDGQVLSSESLAPRRNASAQGPIRVRVRFSEEGLVGMLNQLAGEHPDVVIGDLSVQTLPLPPEARPLDVTITLSGPV